MREENLFSIQLDKFDHDFYNGNLRGNFQNSRKGIENAPDLFLKF